MAGNPRIDDLRKRLEKDPASRLFAQLAEELRKDGELEEAINVCREGLKKQPAYPSARMTLGRALFDTGDVAAARAEFETVLKGAPDNILASRLLAECLEGLGELAGAVKQYKTTLAMAPGDKQLQAHLDGVEKRMKAGPTAAPPPAAPSAPPPPSASAATIMMPAPRPSAPAPKAGVFEPASDTSPDRYPRPEPVPEPPAPARTPDKDFAPIPLASVGEDETFELEAAHASPPTKVGGGTAGGPNADWVVGIAMPLPPPEGQPGAAPPAPEHTYPMPQPEFPMPEEPATIIEPPAAAQAEEAFELERPYEAGSAQREDFAEEFVPPAPEPPRLPPLEPEPPPPVRRPSPPMERPEPAMDATVMMQAPELPAPPVAPAAPPPVSEPPRWSAPPPAFEPPAPVPVFEEPAAPPPVFAEPAFVPRPVFEEPVEPEPVEEEPVVEEPVLEEPAAPAPAAFAEPVAPPAPVAEPAAPTRAEPDLSSSTLAELYFNQGFTDKALAVYQQLLQREPGNERARARVAEIEGLEKQLRAEESRGPEADQGGAQDPAAARRQAIERTIARLESLLAAVKKGER